MRFPAILLVFSLSAAVPMRAVASEQSQASLASLLDSPATKKSWGFTFVVSDNSNLRETNDVDHSQYLQITTKPTYHFNDAFKASLYVIHSQDLRGERDLTVYDSGISVAYSGFQANPYLKLSAASGSKLPLSKTWRDDQSLITTLSFAPRATLDLSRTRLAMLGVYYEPVIRRSFHRYDVSASGTSNEQYRLVQSVGIGLALSEKFSFSSVSSYSAFRTYRSAQYNKFSFDETISFQTTPALSFDLGIGNTGDTLKDNAIDSNIALFDKNVSEVSLGATYVF